MLREKTFQAFDVHPHQLGPLHDSRLFSRTDLAPWERLLLTNHFRKGDSILLIAGDGGRELASFREAGMEVDALEFSPEMLEKAHRFLDERGLVDRVSLTPRYVLPAPTKEYHGIWIGREFLSTIHGRARRIAFLKQLQTMRRTAPHCYAHFSFAVAMVWTGGSISGSEM